MPEVWTRPRPAPVPPDRLGSVGATPYARPPPRCRRRLRWHLNPIVLIRPDWVLCDSRLHRAQGLVLLLIVALAGVVPLAFVSVIAQEFGDFDDRVVTSGPELTLLVLIVLLVVDAPLREEAICRWPGVLRPRTFLLLPGIALACMGIAGRPDPGMNYGIRLLIDLGILVCAYGLHRLRGRVRVLGTIDRRCDRLWQRLPALPVWLLIVCFALAHLVRFEIQWTLATVKALPFVVLPWMWGGAVMSLARIRFGWWSAVAVHAGHNSAVLLLGTILVLEGLL